MYEENLVDWEESMAKELMRKGLSEEEAWWRIEKVHMELTKEESQEHWRIKESRMVAEAILRDRGWKVRYVGWSGDPETAFELRFEVIEEGDPLDDIYYMSVENYEGKKVVTYCWWY